MRTRFLIALLICALAPCVKGATNDPIAEKVSTIGQQPVIDLGAWVSHSKWPWTLQPAPKRALRTEVGVERSQVAADRARWISAYGDQGRKQALHTAQRWYHSHCGSGTFSLLEFADLDQHSSQIAVKEQRCCKESRSEGLLHQGGSSAGFQ